MERSAALVAASLWLLASCGADRGRSAPSTPRAAQSARSSYVPTGASGPQQTPGNAGNPSSASTTAAQAASFDSSGQELAEHYGSKRALSVQLGSGSYYADKFAGRSTASGKPYEPGAFTAAHRSLPFGSVLRVTRKDGGQVVYVRVTDRGPYGPRGRIVDLSRAAAEQLGMLRAGVVELRLEVLEYGPKKKPRKRRH